MSAIRLIRSLTKPDRLDSMGGMNSPVVVWANHTSKSLAPSMQSVRARVDRLITSSYLPDHGHLFAGDMGLTEPGTETTETEYVDWLIEATSSHGATHLLPWRRHIGAVCRAADRFAAHGVQVLAPAPDPDALEDKWLLTRTAEGLGVGVATTYLASTREQADQARQALTSAEHIACVKPRTGVGAIGFRVLDTDDDFDPAGEEWLVMELMPGDEWSVDILADHGQVLDYQVRHKDGWERHVSRDEAFFALVAPLVAHYGLNAICNVQVRQRTNGQYALLEINARAAGGTSQGIEHGIDLYAGLFDHLAACEITIVA